MQQQIQQFRHIITARGFMVEDFALNVDGDAFRRLLAGQPVELEVSCLPTRINRRYRSDGTGAWLDRFAADLEHGDFAPSGGA